MGPYPLVVHSCRAFEPWLPNDQSVGIGCVVLNANSWRHGYLRGKGHIFLYRRFGLCSCFFLIDSFFVFNFRYLASVDSSFVCCFDGCRVAAASVEMTISCKGISEERVTSSHTGGSDRAFVFCLFPTIELRALLLKLACQMCLSIHCERIVFREIGNGPEHAR